MESHSGHWFFYLPIHPPPPPLISDHHLLLSTDFPCDRDPAQGNKKRVQHVQNHCCTWIFLVLQKGEINQLNLHFLNGVPHPTFITLTVKWNLLVYVRHKRTNTCSHPLITYKYSIYIFTGYVPDIHNFHIYSQKFLSFFILYDGCVFSIGLVSVEFLLFYFNG